MIPTVQVQGRWSLPTKRWPSILAQRKRHRQTFPLHGDPGLREIVALVRNTVENNIGEEPQQSLICL